MEGLEEVRGSHVPYTPGARAVRHGQCAPDA